MSLLIPLQSLRLESAKCVIAAMLYTIFFQKCRIGNEFAIDIFCGSMYNNFSKFHTDL